MFDSQKLYSMKQVAEELNISVKTVSRRILKGELPSMKIGGMYRMRGSDLNAYLERGSTKPLEDTVERAYVPLSRVGQPTAVDLKKSYSLSEAAAMLNISEDKARKLANDGTLPVESTGKSSKGAQKFAVNGIDLAYSLDVQTHLSRISSGNIGLESILFCTAAVEKGRLPLKTLRHAVSDGYSELKREAAQVTAQFNSGQPIVLSHLSGSYPITIPSLEAAVKK